jgi:hypothetical protein
MFRKLMSSSWLSAKGKPRAAASASQEDSVSSASDGAGGSAPAGADADDELEILVLDDEQRSILLSSWKVIYSKMGSSLCYASGTSPDGSDAGIAETFLRLFQEYPRSQEFFTRFRDTPVDALRSDLRLSAALQEHAVRVIRVVEKVVGR